MLKQPSPEYRGFRPAGIRLREEPARDACFKVVRRDSELHTYDSTEEIARRELGLIKPGERVFIIKDIPPAKAPH